MTAARASHNGCVAVVAAGEREAASARHTVQHPSSHSALEGGPLPLGLGHYCTSGMYTDRVLL